MNPLVTLRIALRALLRNRMRSFLTMLGIIIGVAAVIAMVAIGEGAKAQVEASFAAMGTNLLIVMPGATTASGVSGGFGSGPTLTWDDLEAIQTELPSVRAAAPVLRRSMQLVSDEQNWATSLNGVTQDYFRLRSWAMDKGIAITQPDLDGATKIVVLGQTVVEKLFGRNTDPVGQIVRIGNVPFEIVGVAARKGQSTTGQDFDDVAFIPVTTFQRKIQGGLQRYLAGQIYVGAVADVAKTEKDVRGLLRDRHHLAPSDDDDFSVRNLTEIAGAQAQGKETLTMLLASVAAVSLLVGGIGIMNIMLVSVTERTREIGVRMALGAKPRHILSQFLVEALALALVGGLLGVLLGVGAAGRIALQFGWPMKIRSDVTLVAVGFSAFVGVLFGLYPARKASKLDPIQALRFE